jgi:disulfide bond formation protein DsbB
MALFPIAWILGLGAYRNDQSCIWYVWPFVILGGLAAIYQMAAIHYPAISLCKEQCAEPIFSFLGFLTFPDLSALGFLIIGACIWRLSLKKRTR